MPVKKRYSSPSKLKLDVIVEGAKRTIDFPGFDAIRKRRFFETKEKALQEALEKTQAFDSFFVLDFSEGEEDEPILGGLDSSNISIQPFETTKDGLKLITKKNAAEAKRWLVDEFNVPAREIMKKALVVEKAKELGFKLGFECDQP